VLLVRFVDANSTPQAQAPHVSAKGQASLNKEAVIIDKQEQAPQTASLAAGVSARVGIESVVAAYMTHQFNFGHIRGKLGATVCFAVPGGRGSHHAFGCSSLAGTTPYLFEGVVNRATHEVTYCRHYPDPVKGVVVPISPVCLH
jgi:hypothetical protein